MTEENVECGDIVVGTGSQVGEPDNGCEIENIEFEKLLLDLAQGKAETDAISKCPKGCQRIELVASVLYERTCTDGVVTVTFTGKYRCMSES